MANKGRPGVMMYFDVRPGLESLTTEEKGILFDAIMDYAELGILPEFASPALRIAWGFIHPRIDSDAVRYENVRQRRRQAANKRWSTEEAAEDGMQMHANDANASTCMQMMPTQLSSTTTQHNSSHLSSTTTQHSTTQSAPSLSEEFLAGHPFLRQTQAAIDRLRAAKQEDSSEE